MDHVSLTREQLLARLDGQLTSAERDGGVVYATANSIPRGTALQLPDRTIHVPADALLAFVDRDPLANWGHPCRYVLVEAATGRMTSIEARFPPFSANIAAKWTVVHQASSVPDSALAVVR